MDAGVLSIQQHGTVCEAHREFYPPGLWRFCSLCKHGHPHTFFVKGATRCVYCILNPKYSSKFALHVVMAANDHLRKMIDMGVLSPWKLNEQGQHILKCPSVVSFRQPRVKREQGGDSNSDAEHGNVPPPSATMVAHV